MIINDKNCSKNNVPGYKNIPVMRFLKEPATTLTELYQRYPNGGEYGWFAFVYEVFSFAAWDMEERKWKIINEKPALSTGERYTGERTISGKPIYEVTVAVTQSTNFSGGTYIMRHFIGNVPEKEFVAIVPEKSYIMFTPLSNPDYTCYMPAGGFCLEEEEAIYFSALKVAHEAGDPNMTAYLYFYKYEKTAPNVNITGGYVTLRYARNE